MMSESIDLEWIGRHIREIQAEQRSINQKIDLLYKGFGQTVSRSDLLESINFIVQRVTTAATLMETRFDQLLSEIGKLQ